MYLNFLVKVPDVPGKIVRKTKNGTTYIDLEIGRTYIPEKRYTAVKRTTIGKQSPDDCNILKSELTNLTSHGTSRPFPKLSPFPTL